MLQTTTKKASPLTSSPINGKRLRGEVLTQASDLAKQRFKEQIRATLAPT